MTASPPRDRAQRNVQIGLAVLVGLLAVVVVMLVVLWQSGDATPSATSPSATPAASASSPTPKPTPTAVPSPTPAEGLAVDHFAEVVTTDLVVRSAPGTDADSEIFGTIATTPVYVLDGPEAANGYEWWLITPVQAGVLDIPPSGWVAAGGKDGELWLGPGSVACDESPQTDELLLVSAAQWVGCYSGIELTLDAYLDGCAAPAGGAWEHGCTVRSPAYDPRSPDDCAADCYTPGIIVHLPTLSARMDGPIRLSGHFDDPAAQQCGGQGDGPLKRLHVFSCRVHFVATSYEFTD